MNPMKLHHIRFIELQTLLTVNMLTNYMSFKNPYTFSSTMYYVLCVYCIVERRCNYQRHKASTKGKTEATEICCSKKLNLK